MEIVTRAQAIKNLQKYIGKDLFALAKKFEISPFKNGKQDKGWKGQILTICAGLKRDNFKAPNGLGFELKSVAFVKKGKSFMPKETMAITMINPKELTETSFFQSHCWEKLKALVFCAVEWTEKNQKSSAYLLNVTSFDFQKTDEIIKEIEEDYEFIRKKLINKGFNALTGKDGKWIQARTKGIGGINPKTKIRRPITRAFYARKKLVKVIFGV